MELEAALLIGLERQLKAEKEIEIFLDRIEKFYNTAYNKSLYAEIEIGKYKLRCHHSHSFIMLNGEPQSHLPLEDTIELAGLISSFEITLIKYLTEE